MHKNTRAHISMMDSSSPPGSGYAPTWSSAVREVALCDRVSRNSTTVRFLQPQTCDGFENVLQPEGIRKVPIPISQEGDSYVIM